VYYVKLNDNQNWADFSAGANVCIIQQITHAIWERLQYWHYFCCMGVIS